MATKDSPLSYADMLMDRLAHAPLVPSRVDDTHKHDSTKPEDAIQPELVAAVTNMGRFNRIHPTQVLAGEVLPEGFFRSCTCFLLCDDVLEVQVNQEKVKQDTKFLKQHAIVAYFVGGQQSPNALIN